MSGGHYQVLGQHAAHGRQIINSLWVRKYHSGLYLLPHWNPMGQQMEQLCNGTFLSDGTPVCTLQQMLPFHPTVLDSTSVLPPLSMPQKPLPFC
jgi:hypothetical protein